MLLISMFDWSYVKSHEISILFFPIFSQIRAQMNLSNLTFLYLSNILHLSGDCQKIPAWVDSLRNIVQGRCRGLKLKMHIGFKPEQWMHFFYFAPKFDLSGEIPQKSTVRFYPLHPSLRCPCSPIYSPYYHLLNSLPTKWKINSNKVLISSNFTAVNK